MNRTIDRNEVVKRAREKKKNARVNLTVRLPQNLMDRFRATCEKEKLTITEVIEELVVSFTGDKPEKR